MSPRAYDWFKTIWMLPHACISCTCACVSHFFWISANCAFYFCSSDSFKAKQTLRVWVPRATARRKDDEQRRRRVKRKKTRKQRQETGKTAALFPLISSSYWLTWWKESKCSRDFRSALASPKVDVRSTSGLIQLLCSIDRNGPHKGTRRSFLKPR